MREIITSTGASLFTAFVLIAQTFLAPPPAGAGPASHAATVAVAPVR